MTSVYTEEKIIEIETAILHRRKDGIIHITFKDQTELDLELQDTLVKLYNELAEGKKRLFLFSAFSDVTVSKEARDRATELENVYPAIATAIVADTIAYKLIANFFIKMNKPKTPYKVFTNSIKAELWLKSFIN